jgi:phosphohistidine phosphatase
MREVVRGLRNVVPEIDVLATSPLVRAVQTAEIVGETYGQERVVIEALRPGAPYHDLSQWAGRHGGADVIAVVGHEPHLSGLVSWLLSGATESFLDLKKGGACLLEIDGTPGPRSGLLLWALAPKHLRAIGRG